MVHGCSPNSCLLAVTTSSVLGQVRGDQQFLIVMELELGVCYGTILDDPLHFALDVLMQVLHPELPMLVGLWMQQKL